MQIIQKRQSALLEIIDTEPVYSQEELVDKLKERGISATQATLSRDLKALGIVKVPGSGYKRQAKKSHPSRSGIADGVQSIEFSGPVAVMKTMMGLAPAMAIYIDSHPLPPIMGTLAGDDTLLLIIRQNFSREDVLDSLLPIIPDIKNLAV